MNTAPEVELLVPDEPLQAILLRERVDLALDASGRGLPVTPIWSVLCFLLLIK